MSALLISHASRSKIAPQLAVGGLLALASIAAASAYAKTPEQIFAQDAPSIVVVTAYDASGKPAMLGSGVVIAQGQVVTNCHVIKDGVTLRVMRDNIQYPAQVHYADSNRDLCQLSVPQLTAPPIEMGDAKTLHPGADLVAIGAPEGLELTISSGLVSSLRDFGDGTKIIQTTAAISPGSSGGGLFDDQGRLVGITAAYLKGGQNLNFALPVNWIAQLPNYPAAVQAAKTSTLNWMTSAFALENKKDWKELLDLAQRWVRAQPKNAMAWNVLGESYGFLHEYVASVGALEQANKLNSASAIGWYNLGDGYVQLQQYPAALGALENAVKLNPDYASAWADLGIAHSGLQQYAEAVSELQQAIRLDPSNPVSWAALGFAYGKSGLPANAVTALTEATKLDPNLDQAWRALGAAYGGLKQFSAAKSANEQAIKLNPSDAFAWSNLGADYANLQQYSEAASALEQAIKLDPNNAQSWFVLGFTYSMQGNRDGAIDAYQHLRKLDSTMADKLFNIAVIPH